MTTLLKHHRFSLKEDYSPWTFKTGDLFTCNDEKDTYTVIETISLLRDVQGEPVRKMVTVMDPKGELHTVKMYGYEVITMAENVKWNKAS